MEKCSFMQFSIYYYHCYHACKKCNIYLNRVYKSYIPTYRWQRHIMPVGYGLCLQFHSRHYNIIRYATQMHLHIYLLLRRVRTYIYRVLRYFSKSEVIGNRTVDRQIQNKIVKMPIFSLQCWFITVFENRINFNVFLCFFELFKCERETITV